MNITLSVLRLYPQLMFWVDFIVEDTWNWAEFKWYNKDIKQPTEQELQLAWNEILTEQEINKYKTEKKEAIEKIASISDQLNLIASVLDTITSENPNTEIISEAKAKFSEIKNILNK